MTTISFTSTPMQAPTPSVSTVKPQNAATPTQNTDSKPFKNAAEMVDYAENFFG